MKPFGIASLDALLCGGLPCGVVDLCGPESSGKTALGASLITEAQRLGRPALLVSTTELDVPRYLAMGLDPDTPIAMNVDTWRELGILLRTAFNHVPDLLAVVDCASVLESTVNYGGLVGADDNKAAYNEIVNAIEGLQLIAERNNCTAVLINEVRDRMDFRGQVRSALGVAMHTVTAQLTISRVITVSLYGRIAYKKTTVKLTRSNSAPPNGICTIHVFPLTGVDKWYELLKYYIECGIAVPKGSYWVLDDGTQIGPGFTKATKQLRELNEA